MNIVYTLEKLGYENGVDFEHRKLHGLIWLSETKPKPSDEELANAWSVLMEEQEDILLERDRTSSLLKIDGLAGRKRKEYISRGTGQDLVYTEKVKEAEEFIANGYNNPEQYPFINKEAEALGKTPTNIADTIVNNKTTWIEIGSEIEKVRLSAKKLVREASTREEIESIVEQVKIDLKSI